MRKARQPWVFCRECAHFRAYSFSLEDRGFGYCAIEPRRHRLDRDRKRHCPDFEKA